MEAITRAVGSCDVVLVLIGDAWISITHDELPESLAKLTYRSTAEALKHARYLYVAKAGPYLRADPHQQQAPSRSESR
ncbi:DUF4231 domain-containing protein [Arthrobacter sp. BB-1]|uniref:DUF4231 domain-containing protein n=1 Tax=unclassified Arthrobacter TaxID=235627 RepID=UPI001112A409|nr:MULTISPECIES: DUF4231 domain-containing protein [unclassified Arthrobacter]TNB74238.1 DUF4231 domain-containing protein [Arthrobacter sp. BB-1]